MTKAVDYLLALYERDQKLTAEQVVAEATDPTSPLHGAFEWDDQQAAHLYRLDQARLLIRKVEITIEERKVRRFVFLPSTDSYHPIEYAMANRDWRAEALEEFRADAERFERRWADHKFVADAYRRWKGKVS